MRDARVAAGWTQEQLAERLGVTLRTVGNWERSTPPGSGQARLRAVLGDHFERSAEPPLRTVSDAELLAEIARRFTRGAQTTAGESRGHTAPTNPAGESPAEELTGVERAILTLAKTLDDTVTVGDLRHTAEAVALEAGAEGADGVDVPAGTADDLAHRRRSLKAQRIAADEVPNAARPDTQGD